MFCNKCKADNPADKKFCGECGAKLEPAPEAVAVPGDPGAFFCARHKKVTTRVRCGRCETPVCDRCTVQGPTGVRCRDCAKNRVPIRPRGVLHQAGRSLEGAAANPIRTVWYLAIFSWIASLFSGLFGGDRDV